MRTQNPPPLKACRFDSDLGHHSDVSHWLIRLHPIALCQWDDIIHPYVKESFMPLPPQPQQIPSQAAPQRPQQSLPPPPDSHGLVKKGI
jgi:hypothetical protein